MFTSGILNMLTGNKASKYASWSHGRPLTDKGLAKALGAFGIYSSSVREGKVTAKGYRLSDFEDAVARYVPSSTKSPVTPSQPASTLAETVRSAPVTNGHVTGDVLTVLPNRHAGCDGVTGEKSVLEAPAGKKVKREPVPARRQPVA